MHIVIINSFSPERIAWLEDAVSNVHITCFPTPKEALSHVHDADILALWGFQNVQPLLEAAPHVRWVHSLSDGVERLLTKDMAERDILLTNSRGVHDDTVAEHAMALILAWTRSIPAAVLNQAAHVWKRPRPQSLQGKTAVIVGYGHIGRAIAKRLHSFGIRIIGIQRTPRTDNIAHAVYDTSAVASVLPEADIVIAALPATPDTDGFFESSLFEIMKSSALFVNISRASVVDESSLIKALQENSIAGAATDVCSQEPLPPKHPLWDVKNLIITPHIAAMTPDFTNKLLYLFRRNIIAFVNGDPLENIIDKKKGY